MTKKCRVNPATLIEKQIAAIRFGMAAMLWKPWQ